MSKFVLEMKGGRKGLLVNSEDLCSPRAKTRAIVRFTGHNGAVDQFKPTVAHQVGGRQLAAGVPSVCERRQRSHPLPLPCQPLGRDGPDAAVEAAVGAVLEPLVEAGLEVLGRGEGAGGLEVRAQVAVTSLQQTLRLGIAGWLDLALTLRTFRAGA